MPLNQIVIDWNGNRGLFFSMAQNRTTGQSPCVQEMVFDLQIQEFVPLEVQADFNAVVTG